MFKAMMGNAEFSASTNQFRVLPFFPLEIEREHLVTQTLEIIKQADPKDIRKRLRVAFKGEPGLDAGGVTKEVSTQCASYILYCYLYSEARKPTIFELCTSSFNFSAKNFLMSRYLDYG